MSGSSAEEGDTSALTRAELDAVAERMAAAGAELAGPLQSRLIAGGRSNLTYRLEDGTSAWVLRMPPRVGRTPSAHDVAREFRITSALRDSGVPVAPALVLCEDESVIGLPFAVAGFVPGRTIQSRADLATLDDATLEAVTARLVESLASLHGVDHVAVGLERFGRPDAYAERQIKRWSGQWELVGEPALTPLADDLGSRLRGSTFDQRSVGIVHGDYRIDNTILSLEPEPRVAAIVDWELSTIGDPVADVAMMCVYRHSALDLVLGSASAWTSDRLPSPDGLAEAYVAAGGVELVDWEQHLALGYYKLAVIAAGIDHRYRVGATHGEGFDSAREAVAPLLEAGIAVLMEPA
ncbi:phosphotransferase family protein [Nocardioides dongkuii]|uniref:phosphotransferase family protein n=1 Tax=Nocardioides dongkuii TaxID=2760089 RepID=UPI001FD3BA72|nr:phosphotransferase family protein [Nocardioides dongkuii]